MIKADLISRVKKKKAKIIYFSSIHVYENFKIHKAKTSDLLNSRRLCNKKYCL